MRGVFDIFEDICHINAVVEYIGLGMDEAVMYLKQKLSDARSKVVNENIGVLVKIVEAGGRDSKEGRLSVGNATKYVKDMQNFVERLQSQKKDIQQIRSEFLNAYRGDGSERENLSKRFDELVMKVDDAIDKLQSRLEIATATKTSYSPQPISEIIDDICGNGTQVLTVEDNLPANIQVDANRLIITSAILNIVVNAVHFAKKKEGDNAKIRVVLTEENGFVRIAVIDNGEGIPKELLEMDAVTGRPRLFNLNVSQREGGTGLGTTEAWYAVKDMGGTIEVQSDLGKGTTFTIRLPISGGETAGDKKRAAALAAFPRSERVHAVNLQGIISYIQAQASSLTSDERRVTSDEQQPLMIALGTSWIEGYKRSLDGKSFRYLQGQDLNELIISMKNYCESKRIPFLVDDDEKLPARIEAERAKGGRANARVVVLAGKDAAASDDFAALRDDKKNAFVVGVDNQRLTADSYIRLPEMLTIALRLSADIDVPQDSTLIKIVKDEKLHIYIFTPPAQPMNYEELKAIYEVQKFA